MNSKIGLADAWKNGTWQETKSAIETELKAIEDSINGLGDLITTDATTKKIAALKTTAKKYGFAVDGLSEEALENIDEFISSRDDITQTKILEDTLKKMGVTEYNKREEYYTGDVATAIANGQGDTVDSYVTYLEEQVQNAKDTAVASVAAHSKTSVTGLQELGMSGGDADF
jgi:hypothetical protein